jgi:hypothetical protein
LRDPYDWNEIRKVLIEVGGEGNLLTKLTALSPEMIQKHVWGNNIPPEFFITGSLTEVTVGEKSTAAGVTFAGFGVSTKVVQTSVAGTLEVTDPYTGELLVAVMGQNRVTAHRVGAEAFKIISWDGKEEYLNAEFSTAKEMIKQQVQVELVDFLFYKAFQKLIETKPEYLTQRLHYRAGRIQYLAKDLAEKIGLSEINEAAPTGESNDESMNSISKVEVIEVDEQASETVEAQKTEPIADETTSEKEQLIGSNLTVDDELQSDEIVNEQKEQVTDEPAGDDEISDTVLANEDEPADDDELKS